MKSVLCLLLLFLTLLTGCSDNKAFQNEKEETVQQQQMPIKEAEKEPEKNEDEISNLKYARFSLAYIDDDDIPELLVCYGDSHADTVSVYKVGSEKDLILLGRFGETGTIKYCEKANLIESSAGGMGVWHSLFYRILDHECILDSWFYSIEKYTDKETETHYAYCLNVNEPYRPGYYFSDTEPKDHECSKEEYNQKYSDFLEGYEEPTIVRYKDMLSLEEMFSNNSNGTK